MKYSYRDLRCLFERGISVRDITEPLASFDRITPINLILDFMELKRFDIIGVRDNGHIIGYAIKQDLKSGILGNYTLEFQGEDIIQDHDSLFLALDKLQSKQWLIVNILNHSGGIVTRGDLQKQPVRMWLFGIISILDMQLSKLIEEKLNTDEWFSLISGGRQESANKIFGARKKDGVDISLIECIQICDKSTIIQKSENLRMMLGFDSAKKTEAIFKSIQILRDSLAHSNQLVSSSWPEYVACAKIIEELLGKLEN